jgi:hypothetical protein
MKISKKILVSVRLVLVMVLSSCGVQTISGSGVITSESRDVSGITRIELDGMGRMILTQGDEESLTIETDDNLLQYITTDVRGQSLQIKFEKNMNLVPTESIIIYVNLKNLSAISLSGGTSIESKRLATERLEITLSGMATVNVDWLTATELKIVSDGTGNIVLAGNVGRQEIELNSLGNYTTPNLQSQITEIVVGGAGNAVVWAEETLDVEGDVSYFGTPEVNYKDSGFGDLKSMGDK